MEQKQFMQLMPVGYSLEPKVEQFVILSVNKRDAEKMLQRYRKVFPDYLHKNDLIHLKLIRAHPTDKESNLQIIIQQKRFKCYSQKLRYEKERKNYYQDFEGMYQQFSDEVIIVERLDIPIESPIDRQQMSIWEKYWSMSSPSFFYPAPLPISQEKALELLNLVEEHAQINKNQGFRGNSCVLYDPRDNTQQMIVNDQSKGNPTRHAIMVLMDKWGSREDEDQYYVKDLVVVIHNEPCIMCSMALVHSRVKAVFYRHFNNGGMNHTLQINNLMNHKFPVFYKI